MRVDTSGNVGIGTSSPSGRLHAKGGNSNTLFIDNDGSQYTSAFIQNNGTTKANLYWDNTNAIYNLNAQAASSQMALWTANTERLRIDSSGNVGIGTSSPVFKLDIQGSIAGNFVQGLFNSSTGAGAQALYLAKTSGGSGVQFGQTQSSLAGFINVLDNAPLLLLTNGSERARINSSGNLLVGATTSPEAARLYSESNTATTAVPLVLHNTATGSTSYNVAVFYRNTASTGSISTTNNATAYNTSSDYRLKENIQPMTGALAKVAALKPCTYTWKDGGIAGEGFIAHELQAVCPDAVTGEKDAVNADGKPVYQGIDTSFLVATLTAAIQELKAELDATKAEVAALKGA